MAKRLTSYIKDDWPLSFKLRIDRTIVASKTSISNFRISVSDKLKNSKIKHKSLFLVALDEVVTNIAEHALKFDNKKKIRSMILVYQGRIAMVIKSGGKAFDPNKNKEKSPHAQFAKGADGGYGMYIYKRVFLEIDYYIEKDQNVMVLYFEDKKIKI